MPFASNRKYATTSIIPFNAVPTIPNNQFFEAIEIIKVKFALGPLRIKKENMLARNIRHENPKNLYIIILP